MIAAFVLTMIVQFMLRAGAYLQQDKLGDAFVAAMLGAWGMWVLLKVVAP